MCVVSSVLEPIWHEGSVVCRVGGTHTSVWAVDATFTAGGMQMTRSRQLESFAVVTGVVESYARLNGLVLRPGHDRHRHWRRRTRHGVQICSPAARGLSMDTGASAVTCKGSRARPRGDLARRLFAAPDLDATSGRPDTDPTSTRP